VSASRAFYFASPEKATKVSPRHNGPTIQADLNRRHVAATSIKRKENTSSDPHRPWHFAASLNTFRLRPAKMKPPDLAA